MGTGERAGRNLTHRDEKCKRCRLTETGTHLFFACNFARAVWFSATTPLRADALPIGKQGVQTQLTTILGPDASPAQIHKTVVTLWYIWKARNENRFDRKIWSVLQVKSASQAELNKALSMLQDPGLHTTTEQLHSVSGTLEAAIGVVSSSITRTSPSGSKRLQEITTRWSHGLANQASSAPLPTVCTPSSKNISIR